MTTQNDSETKGPDSIFITPVGIKHTTEMHIVSFQRCVREDIEYIRADLYTQSQHELAEAQRELAEVKRERDRLQGLIDGSGTKWDCYVKELQEERDRYREALVWYAEHQLLSHIDAARKALNQTTTPNDTGSGEVKHPHPQEGMDLINSVDKP